jgi:hypothetical protein
MRRKTLIRTETQAGLHVTWYLQLSADLHQNLNGVQTDEAIVTGVPQGADEPQKKQQTTLGSIPTVQAEDRPVRCLGVQLRFYSSETRHLPPILPWSGTKATEITAPLLHFGRPIKSTYKERFALSATFPFHRASLYTCVFLLLVV